MGKKKSSTSKSAKPSGGAETTPTTTKPTTTPTTTTAGRKKNTVGGTSTAMNSSYLVLAVLAAIVSVAYASSAVSMKTLTASVTSFLLLGKKSAMTTTAIEVNADGTTNTLTTERDDSTKWTELDFDNFQDTIQSHEWTCVLLYDPWDERTLEEKTLMLEGIYDKLRAAGDQRVGFARINGRKHSNLREEYTQIKVGSKFMAPNPFARDYFDALSDKPNSLLTINNETLLDISLGTPYWPSQMWILNKNYNMYGSVDMNLMTGTAPLQIQVLARWLVQAIRDKAEDMEPLVTTESNLEKEEIKENQEADNTFNFEAYDRMQAEMKESMKDSDDDDSNPASIEEAPRNIRLMLETDSQDDKKASNKGFFTYRKAKVKKIKSAEGYIRTLGTIVDEYLGWCEGWETTWSEERKARENEQTNFGKYFKQMNEAIEVLLGRVLNPHDPIRKDPKLITKMHMDAEFAKQMQIPNLRGYFEELVFGSGRSPHRLRKVLHQLKTQLGSTAKERRRNRFDFNMTEIALVPRLREYLTVYAAVDEDDKLYAGVLAELLTDFHNLLRDFHKNLNTHYTKWLKNNPRPNGNKFLFQKMDILDMEDPTNFEILSNYDMFHDKYTMPGTPVILSNVKMTNEPLTLDYIIEECQAADVTTSVHISRKVGERVADSGWGGLREYELEWELATDSRKKKEDDKEDDSAEDSDDEGDFDKSLTMKQYSILAEKLEHLYLHDYGLPDHCDRILYDETLYNRNQKFKIPSVIASWDLFQRVPQSSYWTSWPSLFVGKKGSNSKLHIDSGGTGFFMYLVSGRKRWVVYNRDERVHLYEKIEDYATYPDVLGMGKDQESDDFLSNRFPLLHRAEAAYEIIQEPGQLVYIPPSCPHAVENLDDTVGLAMNFVTKSGMANHFHEQLHGKMELAVLDVALSYWLFEDSADKPTATKDPLYTTYGEYKAQY